MSERVRLTLRAPLGRRLDADCIVPSRFASLGQSEIAALEIWDGHEARPLGDLFTVVGDRASSIVLEGDLSLLDAVGTGMTGGEFTVAGSIGRAAGARMSGGTIRIEGNAGDDAGLAMAGGLLAIGGNAGDRAGGALAGASKGMIGGEIIVRGSVGRTSGSRMRRGILYCNGAAEGTGESMIAGNIIVAGALGDGVGLGNKRGSVVVLSGVRVPATYAYACTYRPPHLGLMLLSLRKRYDLPIDDAHLHGLYRRYSGDLAEIGKGEILEWQAM